MIPVTPDLSDPNLVVGVARDPMPPTVHLELGVDEVILVVDYNMLFIDGKTLTTGDRYHFPTKPPAVSTSTS